jgi:thiol-disulfide isomerase/thioredoxin
MQKSCYFFLIIIFTTNVLLLQGCSKKETEKKATKPDVQVEGKDEQKNIIHGVVYNEDGKPVAGALVLPLPYGGYPVESDVNGKFELMGPSPSEDRYIFSLFARDPKHNIAAAVELGDCNKPVEITLIEGVTLSGRVTNPQGKPIAGANIFPSVNRKKWMAAFGFTVFQPTDINGVYEIKALPVEQDYTVNVKSAMKYGKAKVRLGLLEQPGRKEIADIILPPVNQPDKVVKLIGKPAPDFPENAQWINSKPLRWKDLKGKVVILNFWAVWCGPCILEMPRISELHKKREENGITVIGIHTAGSKLEDIQKAIKKYDLRHPICIDIPKVKGENRFGLMSSEYGINQIPHAFVIDHQGNVVDYGWGGIAGVVGKANELVKQQSDQKSDIHLHTP